jgi:hypothetical protein
MNQRKTEQSHHDFKNQGNSIAILKTKDYDTKINNSISSNNFALLNMYPTNSYQEITGETVNSSKSLIKHENKLKYIKLDPTS